MSKLSVSLSTLRRMGRPTTTQDSLPAAGQLYRAGFAPAGFQRKVSEVYSLHLIPLPQASPGAMTPSVRRAMPGRLQISAVDEQQAQARQDRRKFEKQLREFDYDYAQMGGGAVGAFSGTVKGADCQTLMGTAEMALGAITGNPLLFALGADQYQAGFRSGLSGEHVQTFTYDMLYSSLRELKVPEKRARPLAFGLEITLHIAAGAGVGRLGALSKAPQSVTMAQNAGLTHTADLVRQYAPRVTPAQGFTDVFIHGTATGDAFAVLHNGQWVTVSHRSLATYLRNQGITGDIRLISCNTGAGSAGHNLANQLGVTVRAPTNTITVHPNGTLTAPTGTVWQDFVPGVRP